MKLYLADISTLLPRHRDYISPQRLAKALRCRVADDRNRCIAGGVLLRKFLGDTPVSDNGFGKPVAGNGVCFNLSHSGGWVLLAVGEQEVGCDIERLRTVNCERMGRIVFTDGEMEQIKNAPDRTGAFFDVWTKKEALLKCMGKGFHRAAKSVDVSGGSFSEDGTEYFLKTKRFSDYVISVCSTEKGFSMEPEFVDLRTNQ